jgi:amino acid adenylation domain-containing protein
MNGTLGSQLHSGDIERSERSSLPHVSFPWNDTDGELSSESNVARLFERQARRSPEAIALMCADDRVSYSQLDGRSNRLARVLRRRGVAPGVLVGISLERSIQVPIAVLAILKAGGAYVALDPEYPRERIAFMLEDSGVPIVLTDSATAGHLPVVAGRALALDSAAVLDSMQAENPGTLEDGADREDPAYVLYTSGSTGQPKGVGMPHRALLNLIEWQVQEARNPAAKTLQFASLNFDVSFQEMFSTWCGGGILQLISEELRRNPTALWELIREESIERLFLPFIALQQLAEAAEQVNAEAPSLRDVITAGEQLQITPQIRRFFEPAGRLLHNHYGPSETHVVTAFTLQGPPAQWPALPPIGRPIRNARVYLLDPDRQPVEIGAPGEIYIGGECVASGYWKRPELTAEKFIPDPFQQGVRRRLYRTGDVGRCDSDGQIEFLGRLDDQAKIRGFRVEPGEVSAALGQHPAVAETAVAVREDGHGDKILAAYVVFRSGETAPSGELRSFLKAKLPDYMIPSFFVSLPSLPLTPSGKVDRRALPDPQPRRDAADEEFAGPRDDWEIQLAKIWEEVFGMERVGIHDDFFELGGHSLIAGRLFARIRAQFGRDLPPTTLLRAPTIAQLAAFVRSERSPLQWKSLVPIQPGGTRPPLFCMHAGAGTILYYQELARLLGPDQPIYGLQAQGLYGDAPPHDEIEEMAAHYVREIRTVQPEGPYHLAGFCFGGLLAFAVAQRLRLEGSELGLLASFDGGSHSFDYAVNTGEAADQGTLRPWLSYHSRKLSRMRPAEKISYLRRKAFDRIRLWKRRASTRLALPVADFLRRMGRPLPETLRHTYFRLNSLRASKRYKPQPYPGRMVIFETRGLFRDRFLGWEGIVTGGFEIHEVSIPAVDSERYHAAFIPALAGALNEVLAAARSRGGERQTRARRADR